MLTILVKTTVNTNNITLAKKYCRYQYKYFCNNPFYYLLHSTTFILSTVIY